jgi:hypothetical protein
VVGLEGALDLVQARPRQSLNYGLMDRVARPNHKVPAPLLGLVDLVKGLALRVESHA